jgi:hypothetical protein
MKPNTPMADALMLKIRNQYSHETEERHRKRFMEMVRNGDPESCFTRVWTMNHAL